MEKTALLSGMKGGPQSVSVGDYFFIRLTISSVSEAIISSSFVGRTYTLTLESGVESSTVLGWWWVFALSRPVT